jgi:hypothetical protein
VAVFNALGDLHNSLHRDSPQPPSKEKTMKPGLKIGLRSLLVILAIVGVAAFGALLAMQFLPDAANAQVRIGGHHIEVQGIFMRGFFDVFAAWLAISAAIVIGTVVTLLSLALVAVVLGAIAVVLGMPLILMGLVIWFIVRQSRRNEARSALA